MPDYKFNFSCTAELFDYLPVATALIEFNGNIAFLNKKFIELFGYDLSDLKTLNDWIILACQDKKNQKESFEIFKKDIKEAINSGKQSSKKLYSIKCKNSLTKDIEISFDVYKNQIIASFDIFTSGGKGRNLQGIFSRYFFKFSKIKC